MGAENIVQKQVRLVLERQCREYADLLKSKIPAGVGFTLLLFDFGAEGNMAYVSTGERDDSLRMLHEWMEHVGGPYDERLRKAERENDDLRRELEKKGGAP